MARIGKIRPRPVEIEESLRPTPSYTLTESTSHHGALQNSTSSHSPELASDRKAEDASIPLAKGILKPLIGCSDPADKPTESEREVSNVLDASDSKVSHKPYLSLRSEKTRYMVDTYDKDLGKHIVSMSSDDVTPPKTATARAIRQLNEEYDRAQALAQRRLMKERNMHLKKTLPVIHETKELKFAAVEPNDNPATLDSSNSSELHPPRIDNSPASALGLDGASLRYFERDLESTLRESLFSPITSVAPPRFVLPSVSKRLTPTSYMNESLLSILQCFIEGDKASGTASCQDGKKHDLDGIARELGLELEAVEKVVKKLGSMLA